MKKSRLLCLAVIAGFIAYSVFAFQHAVTPYVTFAQAKGAPNTVQVKGTLAVPAITPIDGGRSILFILRDDAGEEVPVVYRGARPEGLEQATGVVAVGQYSNGQFLADRLLVKCPSKYHRSEDK